MNTVRSYRTWPPRPGPPTRLHRCLLALNASAVKDTPLLGSGADDSGRTAIPAPEEDRMHSRVLYRLTFLAAGLSLGHHLDHLIRGNAVGWPVTDQVNAFTASLVVYPIIIAGLL